jgi:cytochrome oxidase assembly protein ShyY1
VPRRLLTLRWIAFTVVVLVLVGLFVQLGRWQLHRLDERHQRNAVTRSNLAAAPVALDAVIGADRRVERDNEWRRAVVTGHYDDRHQIVIRYRNVNNRPGFEIVTPLVLADGSAILVDRGFVARERNSSQLPPGVPDPAAGEVTVTGRLRHSEGGEPAAATPVEGHARLINAPAIAAATGLQLVDGYMTVDEQIPAPAEGLAGLPLPEIDSGPHFFYAMQWFFFALLALGGLVYFAREELRSGRRQEPVAAPAADRRLRADR